MEKIELKIVDFKETYVVGITTAPEAYDYGYVIEVERWENQPTEGKTERIILIPEDKLEWQIGRNASGLHPLLISPEEDDRIHPSVTTWIKEQLFKRLRRKEA